MSIDGGGDVPLEDKLTVMAGGRLYLLSKIGRIPFLDIFKKSQLVNLMAQGHFVIVETEGIHLFNWITDLGSNTTHYAKIDNVMRIMQNDMFLLAQNNYKLAASKLKDVAINHLFARSVIEHHVKGKVYVDDLSTPNSEKDTRLGYFSNQERK